MRVFCCTLIRKEAICMLSFQVTFFSVNNAFSWLGMRSRMLRRLFVRARGKKELVFCRDRYVNVNGRDIHKIFFVLQARQWHLQIYSVWHNDTIDSRFIWKTLLIFPPKQVFTDSSNSSLYVICEFKRYYKFRISCLCFFCIQ